MPVSDVEKTLIDLVYFRETPDADVLSRIKEECDMRKVGLYLSNCAPAERTKVRELLSR